VLSFPVSKFSMLKMPLDKRKKKKVNKRRLKSSEVKQQNNALYFDRTPAGMWYERNTEYICPVRSPWLIYDRLQENPKDYRNRLAFFRVHER